MKAPKRQIRNDLKDIGPAKCVYPGGNLFGRHPETIRHALTPWIHHGGGGFNRFAHSAGRDLGNGDIGKGYKEERKEREDGGRNMQEGSVELKI